MTKPTTSTISVDGILAKKKKIINDKKQHYSLSTINEGLVIIWIFLSNLGWFIDFCLGL